MLPTFIIGMREGIEASLIVGIVAAFLGQSNARRALRWVWVGVAAALVLCAGFGVGLQLLNDELPQRQQEGLETVIAVFAVVMVTSMVVWMARNARGLKGELEGKAATALATGSVRALVLMAFLAVLREGVETAVFLLAAFQASSNRASSSAGAVLGILVAVVVGFAIYKGGVKINLSRFFLGTGLVLVLVAAGLVAFALHTAHEATWLNSGQGQLVDLTWLVKPGSIRSALLTGVLGIQPKPTVIEGLGWALYLVPVTAFVLRSSRRKAGGPRTAPTPVTA